MSSRTISCSYRYSSDDDFGEGRDRRGEIRAERNIPPALRRLLDWNEQNKHYISEQTKVICLPHYSEQNITRRTNYKKEMTIVLKKVCVSNTLV
jgi:hypothetical protein